MRQALHYHSTVASIKVCSFNAISICLRPVQPRFIGRYAVGPANCLGNNAGDVGTVHPAAVDARRAIAPVCPKHQAKKDSNLVFRVKGECRLLRKTSDFCEHQVNIIPLSWHERQGSRLLHHWRIDQSASQVSIRVGHLKKRQGEDDYRNEHL